MVKKRKEDTIKKTRIKNENKAKEEIGNLVKWRMGKEDEENQRSYENETDDGQQLTHKLRSRQRNLLRERY